MNVCRRYAMICMLVIVSFIYCITEMRGQASASADIAIWRTTGVVFEASHTEAPEAEYGLNDGDYQIEDVRVIASMDGVNYCTARLTYNTDKYTVQKVLDILGRSAGYIHIEEDSTLYSDSLLFKKTDSYITSQWYLDAIDAKEAWDAEPEPGKAAVVAVIDTGVDYTHRDLRDNIWINDAEAYGIPGIDDDNNGVVDDIYGANFAADNTDPDKMGDPMDTEDGHGTHVAGIIAMGKDNGGGCGIAYSSKIMPVKAGNADGKFKLSSVIAALDYAVNMGADVINMSFGTYTESSVLKSMLEHAGRKCVLVAAAGNDGYVTSDYADEKAKSVYPASYPCVIGVMAVDTGLNVPAWSNYDYELHSGTDYDIAAPGYNILSTMPGGKYAYMHGTSMAAPMVSATAAILCGSIDKSTISDPVSYIRSQITEATKASTYKYAADGKKITYPLLNVYDSITAFPGIDMYVNGFKYYDNAGNAEFERQLDIEGRTEADIYCGFRISNLWSAAKDITVSVKADSPVCTGSNEVIDIKTMHPVSAIDIQCGAQEAYVFHFAGEAGKTYNIPVIYTLKAVMDDGDKNGTEYIKEFRDNITIYVKASKTGTSDEQVMAGVSGQSADSVISGTADNMSVTVRRVKGLSCKKKRTAKKYKNVISWNRVSGAGKYIIYCSEKKKTGYKKIAATAKKSYVHIFTSKKTYYYKIRAYAMYDGKKVYGRYSRVLKVKR